MKLKSLLYLFSLLLVFSSFSTCKKGGTEGNTPLPPAPPPPPASGASDVAFWLTTADGSVLLKQQTTPLNWSLTAGSGPQIEVDTTATYQTMDGFGFTLTQGSAFVLNKLSPAARGALIRELFSNDAGSIGISYLRLGMGATDLSTHVYSYNDLPAGTTDLSLSKFSLEEDRKDVIPVIKEILAVNPSIKIIATPWSAPVWMKDNGSTVGGSLKPEYYEVYANYFVKYITAMRSEGIVIDAITPQNEPLHAGNNPSMYMPAAAQNNFIKNNLGPLFDRFSLSTKIIIYDHNADQPGYPLQILNDPDTKPFVAGSAFHLYGGDISALSQVKAQHPDKDIYFTEQYTASSGSFGGDLRWHLKNVLIGASRNWAKVVLEWNLANDASFGPHTAGGCTTCLGAVTIANGTVTRNVGYYIIGHAAKFVLPGSVRIGSNVAGALQNVAFKRPDGKKVLIVQNDSDITQSFTIKFNSKWITTSLPAGAAGTYVW